MNIYGIITEKIIGQLSNGFIPWKQCWSLGFPKSLGSKKPYRGINLLLLSFAEYSSQYWLTFKEAQKHGGQVKKGEKGTTIIYWHWRTEEELAALKAGNDFEPAKCFPKIYKVFNSEQCEGLLIPDDDFSLRYSKENLIQRAESIVVNYQDKPLISHGVGANPCYMPKSDKVLLPSLSQFKSANQYYAVLFHELIHSTANEKRLNRPLTDYRSDEVKTYSFEELVAEIGAAFLCAHAGIDDNYLFDNQTAYISNWIKFLETDSSIILKAAREAQKAVDHILGISFEKQNLAA